MSVKISATELQKEIQSLVAEALRSGIRAETVSAILTMAAMNAHNPDYGPGR